MNPKVVLIDDDYGPMEFYVKALESRGFEVEQIDSCDAAFQWLDGPIASDPALVVVDIMLPPGTHLTLEETDGGLSSGVFIARKVRERFPNVPVVALTNLNDSDVLSQLPKDVDVKAKFETSPFQFADFVALMGTSVTKQHR